MSDWPYEGCCAELDPTGIFSCTEEKEHAGMHRAEAAHGRLCATWGRAEAEAARKHVDAVKRDKPKKEKKMPARAVNLDPVLLPEPPPEIGRWVEFVIAKCALKPREKMVLRLILKGLSDEEIGKELALPRGTVHGSVSAIFHRTNTHGRCELMAFVMGTL